MDEGRRIVDSLIFETGREALAQSVHRGYDQRRGLYRIGARREIDADPDRRPAVEAAFGVQVLGSEVDPRDIAHTQQRAVGIGAQHDFAELLGRGKATLRLHVHLQLLVIADRASADPASRRLHVLRLDCGDYIGRCQPQIVQALGIEPDAHRVVEASKEGRLADTGCAGQYVRHVDDRVIGDEQRVLRAVLA